MCVRENKVYEGVRSSGRESAGRGGARGSGGRESAGPGRGAGLGRARLRLPKFSLCVKPFMIKSWGESQGHRIKGRFFPDLREINKT